MKIRQGVALLSAMALTVSLLGPVAASAQWKPTKDVEFVIPFGIGGGADLLARTIIKVIQQEKLAPVSIVAVNKPGGGTASGVGYVVANKNADPYTLVLVNPQTQITPLRVKNAKGWRDLTPVINFMLDDYLLLVRKDSPYKNAADLVSAGKKKGPRAISVGSAGTADDMSIAVFEAATGLKLNIVRFNSGGEILTALLGGNVDLASGNPLEFMGQMQAGAVRPLGVFRATRFAAMPNVPTLKEQGIKTIPFQMWRGVAMPKGVPAEAVSYWAGVLKKVADSKEFKDYISSNVATMDVVVGQDFTRFLGEQERVYKDMLARLGQLPK